MPACPYCHAFVSGQLGIVMMCPHCGGRLRIYRTSPTRRSIPPITSIGKHREPKTSSSGLQPRQHRTEPTNNLMKKASVKVFQGVSPFLSLCEIHKDFDRIVCNLPLDEDQILWEIKNHRLEIKSLRLDFPYKEEVKIPSVWKGLPKAVFLNGVLSFSWEDTQEN